MYENQFFLSLLISQIKEEYKGFYWMLKKGGQIIDNVKKVDKPIINSLNKPPILNKENQSMEYFVFCHHLLSKKLINETLSFKKIQK